MTSLGLATISLQLYVMNPAQTSTFSSAVGWTKKLQGSLLNWVLLSSLLRKTAFLSGVSGKILRLIKKKKKKKSMLKKQEAFSTK